MTESEAAKIVAIVLAMYPQCALPPGPPHTAYLRGIMRLPSFAAMQAGLHDVYATWEHGRYRVLPDVPALKAAHDAHLHRARLDAQTARADRMLTEGTASGREEARARVAELVASIGRRTPRAPRAEGREDKTLIIDERTRAERLKVLREQAASLAREGTYNRRSTPTRDSGVVEDDSASEGA